MRVNLMLLLSMGIYLSPINLNAQQLNEYTISGFVTDITSGAKQAGVMVEAINQADTTQRNAAVTDTSGWYEVNLATNVTGGSGGKIPAEFILEQNYPNPFNPSTVLRFQLPEANDIQLVIYNTLGQKVRTLLDRSFSPGSHSVIWDGTNDAGLGMAAGLYFYQMKAGDFVATKKMLLMDGAAGQRPMLPSATIQSSTSSSKSTELMVTIRATGPQILTFEQKNIVISSSNFTFDVQVTSKSAAGLNRDLVIISEPSAEGIVYVSGLAGAVTGTLAGTEILSVRNQRTQTEIAIRIENDGSFPLKNLHAEVADDLVVTVYNKGRPQTQTELFTVIDNVRPVVIKSKPTNGSKDIIIDTSLFIYFSEPIDSTTINENSFIVADSTGAITGSIDFSYDYTIATFTPAQSLEENTEYRMVMTTEATDLQGNTLISDFIASFTTGAIYSYRQTEFELHLIADYYLNTMRIEAVHPVDIDNDGDIDVLAASSDFLIWDENCGNNAFIRHLITDERDNIYDVYAIDLDGDGDMDVLSASNNDYIIAWYENDGNKNFTSHIITDKAVGARSVFAIDMDSDGDIDVLSAAYAIKWITWHENDGNQNFTTHTIAKSIEYPYSIYATDLDGDNDIDVLAAASSQKEICWYENDGNQNFRLRIIATTENLVRSVQAIDMDNDGDMDVLSASSSGTSASKITWYENDGKQNFSPTDIDPVARGTNSIFAVDLDLDGDTDVLSASESADQIKYFLNDGDQNFMGYTITDQLNGATDVHAADMDGDGDLDVLSAARDESLWFENDGNQNFISQKIATAIENINAIFAHDMDSDGDIDILAAFDNYVSLYQFLGNQRFSRYNLIDNAENVNSINGADIDDDGDFDVVANINGRAAWFENDGSLHFSLHYIASAVHDISSLYLVDMDFDWDIDILVSSNDHVLWLENDDSKNFPFNYISDSDVNRTCIFAKDIEGDKDIDVISGSDIGVILYQNSGNDLFNTNNYITEMAGNVYCGCADDLDDDGDIDLLTGSVEGIAWHENTNNGLAYNSHLIFEDNNASSVHVIDLDLDNDLDVVSTFTWGGYNDSRIIWHENDGHQNYTIHSIDSSNIVWVETAFFIDMDFDGDMDMVIAGLGTGYIAKVVWYENLTVTKIAGPNIAQSSLTGKKYLPPN